MVLSTVDGDQLPDSRVVLLKDFDARGFVFFTNLTSAKSRELEEIPKGGPEFSLDAPGKAGAGAGRGRANLRCGGG